MRSGRARSASISASAALWLPVRREGQGGDQLPPDAAVALPGAAGAPPLMGAHQGERKLAREQLVIGEAGEMRARRLEIGLRLRMMGLGERRGEVGPAPALPAAPDRATRAAAGWPATASPMARASVFRASPAVIG